MKEGEMADSDILASIFAEPTFARETLTTELVDELLPLLRAHYLEIAHYQDIELDPDWDAYAVVQQNNALRVFTARQDGKLVGYCAFFLRKNMHYRKSLQAVNDVI